jgi:3-methyl-2-oxobutanoate hydroxymethyltransferase
MARRTVSDLQQMKRAGKKIAAAVVYEFQMAKICDRAGADLLSVGDSLGRAFLGHESADDFRIDEMIPFARAVTRAAERAVVSVDMPTATCKGGPREVGKAARLLRAEVGADMTKVDIRQQEEELFDDVRAVVETGLAVYPQIGFPAGAASTGLHGDPADRAHILKWAHALEDAGASMIDLTSVTPELYAQVCKELRIPVIGGQTGPEADGRIYVSYSLVGYQAAALELTGQPSAARFIYDIAKKAIDGVHAGKW